MKSNILVLVRHGQSEWNKLNLFTGWKDPNLTQQGIAEASQAGEKLKEMSIKFDLMYTSVLQRAQLTGTIILEKLDQLNIPIEKNVNLNERDYGGFNEFTITGIKNTVPPRQHIINKLGESSITASTGTSIS